MGLRVDEADTRRLRPSSSTRRVHARELAARRRDHSVRRRPERDLGVELGEAPHREVGALQRLDAPGEQHDVAVDGQAELRRGLAPVAGREHGVVDAGRHDLDAVGIGAVERDQLRALLGGRRDHQVGAGDDLGLDPGPGRGLVALARLGLHPIERVEGGDERQIELVLEPVADRARDPVVGVEDVVVELVGGGGGRARRRRTARRGRTPRPWAAPRGGPTGRCTTRKPGSTSMTGGCSGVVGAGEDVARHAGAGEVRRQRPHAHVHPAAVARPGLRERRGVHAEHRNPTDRHGPTSLPAPRRVP